MEEAARESGYSAEHLGRLIRTGRIPNAGRRSAPRVRRGDLPAKPAHRPDVLAPDEAQSEFSNGLFRDIVNSKFGD
jgi:hypothetical protein